MNGLYNLKTPRPVLLHKDQDPFMNMVRKLNKSPLLRPVCVKKSRYLIRSPSEALHQIMLPPLKIPKKNKFSLEIPEIQKFKLKKSDIASPVYLRETKCYSELKIIRLP